MYLYVVSSSKNALHVHLLFIGYMQQGVQLCDRQVYLASDIANSWLAGAKISFCRSQRGRPLLIFLGYKFRREMVKQHRTYWRCLVEKCSGRMITMLPDDRIVRYRVHNHDPTSYI